MVRIINAYSSSLTKFFLFVILLLFIGKVDAKVDSLQQIWLNESYPDTLRFNALNEFCKKESYVQPESVLDYTNYHYELAQQKNSKLEMTNALDNKALALRVPAVYYNFISSKYPSFAR